jgi:hypothetical protein
MNEYTVCGVLVNMNKNKKDNKLLGLDENSLKILKLSDDEEYEEEYEGKKKKVMFSRKARRKISRTLEDIGKKMEKNKLAKKLTNESIIHAVKKVITIKPSGKKDKKVKR